MMYLRNSRKYLVKIALMTHPDIEQIDGTNKEIKKTTDKPSVLLLIAVVVFSHCTL